MRINKFLASSGIASRRKCEEYVLDGRVSVNGKLVKELAFDVNEFRDKVLVDGSPVSLLKPVYVMLHKPKGVVTTKDDDKNRKTVMDLLPAELKNVFPVGRLDYDTEGLLLLTNDGDWAYGLTHPSNEVEKIYHVRVDGGILESELAVLRNGVVIDGERTAKSKARVLSMTSSTTTIELCISEGKNRQIKKMLQAIGKNVLFLKRVQVGEIRLGGLTRGKWRYLRPDEVDLLRINLGDFE